MSTAAPPSAMAPPPPPIVTTYPSQRTGKTPAVQQNRLSVSTGVAGEFHKIVFYGEAGTGKSQLIANINNHGESVLFVDIDDESSYLNVSRVEPQTWDELLAVLGDDSLLDGFTAIGVESLTKAQDLATAWVLANIKNDKGNACRYIEDYGWGKGYAHVYETFLHLLSALDRIHRSGKHIICTGHECGTNVPNPAGEDFLQYQPRLQTIAGGKHSIRHRVKEWCGHLFFFHKDTSVNKEGKAVGTGAVTIYPFGVPTWWAKSRSPHINEQIIYPEGDTTLWKQLLQKGQ